MTLSQDQESRAYIALNRFGLGAKPDSIQRIGKNAKAALEEELNTPGIALINRPNLPNYNQACQIIHTDFNKENGNKERELTARLSKHLQPHIGFVERLVLFFSNHFSMSINKDGAIRATIGQLERDVIRKHVLGSFRSMLLGVMQHPAMIRYLDNDDSIGPASPAGQNWGAGLNQNLAREILELHSMGVGGGYTEKDIDALSRVISGWSFVRGWEADGHYNGGYKSNRGRFIFRKDWHEPGAQKILGKRYGAPGLQQGEDVLTDLARHPSTAQYIAFKLVRHFITDAPTPAMVEPLALAYRQSKGSLKAVAQALIDLPEAWSLPLTKLRRPYELQVAQMRALERTYDADRIWSFNSTLSALRNLPWEYGTPDGFPDESPYWMGPDAMRIRLETAQMCASTLMQVAPVRRSPTLIANQIFGSNLSLKSRSAIAQAIDQRHGLATLFMIPEFQRR